AFSPGDSIMLSFFYQAQGRSFEVLENRDSLVLQFRNRIGAWVSVWRVFGTAQEAFKPVIVSVSDTSYFHNSFRFRWVNYQRYLGNLKQWHVDYVYLNQGRNSADTVFEDQAIVELPQFPFTTYSHIPWPQLKQNFVKHVRQDF